MKKPLQVEVSSINKVGILFENWNIDSKNVSSILFYNYIKFFFINPQFFFFSHFLKDYIMLYNFSNNWFLGNAQSIFYYKAGPQILSRDAQLVENQIKLHWVGPAQLESRKTNNWKAKTQQLRLQLPRANAVMNGHTYIMKLGFWRRNFPVLLKYKFWSYCRVTNKVCRV